MNSIYIVRRRVFFDCEEYFSSREKAKEYINKHVEYHNNTPKEKRHRRWHAISKNDFLITQEILDEATEEIQTFINENDY